MRFLFIITLCLGMTGCVNYIGIHAHSTPLTPTSLAVSHAYPTLPQQAFTPSGQWWDIFKDAELNQLIAVALESSPNIQIAQSRLERARHLAEAAGASLWPNVDLNGYIRREHYTKNGIIPPPFNGTTQNLASLSLNLNYEIDFWGKNRETIAARVSETFAQQAELAQTRLVLSTAIASSYFQFQYDMALISLTKKILKDQQHLLNIIQLRAQHSITSNIPVSSAQIQVQTWELLLAQIEQYADIQRHQLAELMGENPFTTQITVSEFKYNPKLLTLPPVLPASLLGRRPDIDASRYQVEAAGHLVNVEKALFFPDVNLLAFFSFQGIGLNNIFKWSSRDYAAQAAFTLPIFDAGYLRANLKARYDEYDSAVGQYNQTILTALQQVADQLSALSITQLQIQEQNKAATIARLNYQRNDLLYRHGINDYTEVLTAESTWLNQQLFLLVLQNLHVQNTISMINALGGDYTTQAMPP